MIHQSFIDIGALTWSIDRIESIAWTLQISWVNVVRLTRLQRDSADPQVQGKEVLSQKKLTHFGETHGPTLTGSFSLSRRHAAL